MQEIIANLAIGCKAPNGAIGTFLFTGESGDRKPVSPVFPDCVALFDWTRANAWESCSGPSPVGNYRKIGQPA